MVRGSRMAVRRLPATPGWICALNNYQNKVYIIIIYICIYVRECVTEERGLRAYRGAFGELQMKLVNTLQNAFRFLPTHTGMFSDRL